MLKAEKIMMKRRTKNEDEKDYEVEYEEFEDYPEGKGEE